MTRPRLWPSVVGGWAIAAVILTAMSARAISHLWFPDPDDAMRLLEVQDWIAGQSWCDVGQHRLWGGHFAMHWSRLVDLPLAGLLLALRPLLGDAVATRVTVVAIPMITLLVVMALGAALTRRLCGIERAKLAVLLATLSVPMLYQLQPLRVDHHGWQIACALLAVLALLAPPTARSGALLGWALATLLTISLEGLPVTALILGVLLLAWALDTSRRPQALAALWTLTGVIALLQVATRGPAMFAPACDAVAPAWIAALAVATFGASAVMLVPIRSSAIRIGLLGAVGLAALATLATTTPQCLAGPFGNLDPFVRRYWYEQTAEGLPVWQQIPSWAVMTVAFPIVGLIGGALAWRSSIGAERTRWAMMLPLAAGSFGLSLLVMRTGAVANALALPGGAWVLHTLLTRARAIEATLPRALATAGALLTATPGLATNALIPTAAGSTSPPRTAGVARASCDRGHEVADLAILPPTTLFAPLDVTPALLVWTHHRAIGAGYHRNQQSIHRVMATYMADPAVARRLVVESGATYLVGCPGVNETELYKHEAPNGLWARLERGEPVDWLEPVTIPHSPVLVWRVRRAEDRRF